MISVNKHSWFHDCFSGVNSSTALQLEDEDLSYFDIKKRILSVSAYFSLQGVKQNQKVAVLFRDQYQFIISVYALWNIGAVPILINNRLTEKEIFDQIDFVKSLLIITDFSDINFDENEIKVVKFHDETKENIDKLNTLSYNDTALMLFTSGSSGVPKCVKLSFKNLISSVLISDKQFNYVHNSKWIASLPFYHIGGFMIYFRALLTGSSVILTREFNELEKIITKEYPDYISLVPTQLKKLLDKKVSFRSNLKNIFLGGGPIDDNLLNQILESELPITPVYGSTETCSMIAYQTCEELLFEKKISLSPYDDVEIKIIKKSETENIGEIAVKSGTLFLEYYNNEKETKSSFNNDYYLTNDLGYFDNGRLNIVGRKDDVILSGGENISAREIEKEIQKIYGVEKAVVIGVDDEKWGKAAAVLVETELDPNAIEALLKEELPSYKIPKIIKTTDKIPQNEIGKLNRKEIEKILSRNIF